MTRQAQGGDTIFALSSGSPPAAIAVVRVSGPDASAVLLYLAKALPKPRTAHVVALRSASGDLLDRALVLWIPGPRTATGEDLVELHLHGGRATIAAISAELATLPGLRPAEPGEFTRRALANGRFDLAQVEGLADLLAAETEAQRRAALRITEGGLSRLVEGWRQRLLGLSAAVEAAIEFAEEHEEEVATAALHARQNMDALAAEMSAALAAPPAERLRDGVRVVLAGPVNAGKSTLLNALAGREAAIATPIPGTTRDLIEVPVAIGAIPFVLIDSAGLRETEDPVEREGVVRAKSAVASADIVLWLGEPCEMSGRNDVIELCAQCDRPNRASMAGGLRVSALTGEGLSILREKLLDRASTLLPTIDGIMLNSRQRSLVEQARAALAGEEASGLDDVLLAEHLRQARLALDRLTGRAGTEDMLDALFSRFCIGK